MFTIAAAVKWLANRVADSRVRTVAQRLPKAELHLHLDGSLSLDYLYSKAEARGITMPCRPHDLRRMLFQSAVDMDVRKRVLRAMPGFTERDGGGWLRFDFCNQFLQTEIELEDATADLVRRQFHEDNAWVIEIRFCPILHVHEGLTAQQVVDAACRGFAKGCADCGGIGNPIIGGLIICALRNLSQEHGVAMAELAGKNLGKGVIGWDLAAEEGPHPMSKHMAGFRRALELGVPCTVHAGEWGSGKQTPENPHLYARAGHVDSVPNIKLAVEGGCHRLGHAITLYMDPPLMKQVASSDVVIECCLSGNRTRVGGHLSKHPIRKMLAAGCKCTLNTDNRFLGNSTTTREVVLFIREVNGSWQELSEMLKLAGRASFFFAANRIPEARKVEWLSRYEAEIDAALQAVKS